MSGPCLSFRLKFTSHEGRLAGHPCHIMSTTNESWSVPFREFVCVNEWMWYDMVCWWGGSDRVKRKYSKRNLSQCHFVRHESPFWKLLGRNSSLALSHRLQTASAAVWLQNHEFWSLYTDQWSWKVDIWVYILTLNSGTDSVVHILPVMLSADLNAKVHPRTDLEGPEGE